MNVAKVGPRQYGRPDDNVEFVEQERRHRYRWAALGLAFGVVLMPMGGFLDWFVYPSQFPTLLLGRLSVAAMLALGLMTRNSWSSGRLFEPVSFALILLPGLFISWMMYLTDGSHSLYYFGLILLMFILNLLGFRASEAAAFCGLLILSYAVAVFAGDGFTVINANAVIQGFFFLSVCSVSCIAVCYTYRRSRFEAFCLNRDLAEEEELRRRSIIRLRDAEQRLVHSEKMRAIAGVAAGLLHEINNPVNFSLMAIKVLKRRLRDNTQVTETIDDIETGVSRIGDIVSDLQSFAHPEQLSVQTPFMLRDAVDTAIRFLTHELPDGRVVLDEESVEVNVLGAQSQIVQVLLNIILNAEKATVATAALPSIEPDTEKQPSSPDHASGDTHHPSRVAMTLEKKIVIAAKGVGDRLEISVSDSGVGMDQGQLRLVKQPFFTTRVGEGLGLGLGICESIVHSHGGEIGIESELGVGTRVTFDLALATPPKDERPTANESPETAIIAKRDRGVNRPSRSSATPIA